MPKPFNELRERLLKSGVAPRHVRRYLSELADHLTDLTAEEERSGRSRADAESAALRRLGTMDDLAKAITEQRQFQSWSVRTPWAAFGLAPLLFLAASWCVALLILWSGWRVFLPGADSPFVRLHGFAIFYFGVGRLIFFSAPVLIDCGIAMVTIRQRLKPVWPAAGLALIALIGGTLKVGVTRPDATRRVGHIYMGLTSGSAAQMIPDGLFHALVILSLAVLPYLIWRLQRVHSLHQRTR